jgi:hypothetical protein
VESRSRSRGAIGARFVDEVPAEIFRFSVDGNAGLETSALMDPDQWLKRVLQNQRQNPNPVEKQR